MPLGAGKPWGLPRIIAALLAIAGVALTIAAFLLIVQVLARAFSVSPATIIWLIAIVALLALLAWLVFRYHRLPLWLAGMSGAKSIPAIPLHLSELPSTILNLLRKNAQSEAARNSLSTVWTIGKYTETAYTFMGMDHTVDTKHPVTQLTLDEPEQYAMAWPTFGGIYENASRDWLPQFAASLTDPAEATRQFWPTIARFGLPFALIILQRVGPDDDGLKEKYGAGLTPQMEALRQAGNLYVIDMTFFTPFPAAPPDTVHAAPRFTPGTLTFLQRDPNTRAITPFAVRVSDAKGNAVTYAEGDPAWLYALAAARTSITVWGIWIGHVFQLHIVTAAMQMTMFQQLPPQHPVRQVFGRQSEYLIGFDQFLLLDWTISPPTSVASSRHFLEMMDAYAKTRTFFDDDPDMTFKRLGLRMEDFTSKSELADPWNEYPALRYLLILFRDTGKYVDAVVDAFYENDGNVVNDAALQRWIAKSASPGGGNISGLPVPLNTRADLKRVLTSLIYRVTAHGTSRLNQSINPAMTFLGNYPPCLQETTLPARDAKFVFSGASTPGTLNLSSFLPYTGTIGAQIAFGYTFIYTTPYKPFIPLAGIDAELPFTGPPDVVDKCNKALIRYRTEVKDFMTLFAEESHVLGPPAQLTQWELNIET